VLFNVSIELMESKDESVALKATSAILDRAYGKPAQTLNTDLGRKDLLEYSIAELVAIAYGARTGGQTIEGIAEEREPSSIAAK